MWWGLLEYAIELAGREYDSGLVVGPSRVTNPPLLARLASATLMQWPFQPFCDSSSVMDC
jgi:hypothetical protein